MNNLEHVIDYILSHEWEDFRDNLDEFDEYLNGKDKKLILSWLNADINVTRPLKEVFERLSEQGTHIYVHAFCAKYVDELPSDTCTKCGCNEFLCGHNKRG